MQQLAECPARLAEHGAEQQEHDEAAEHREIVGCIVRFFNHWNEPSKPQHRLSVNEPFHLPGAMVP